MPDYDIERDMNDWAGRDAEDMERERERDEAAWAQADADYDRMQEQDDSAADSGD